MIIKETETEKLGKISSVADLKQAVEKLEQKRVLLEEGIKEDVHSILEGLRPSNILKNTVHHLKESGEIRNNLLMIALGLGAGYFSKRLLVGKSAGVLKKTLGTALQYGIAALVSRKKNKEEKSDRNPKRKNLFGKILSP